MQHRPHFIQAMLTPLNFPTYRIENKNDSGKEMLFDIIRQKWVILTPEEWVRQNMIHFFITHLNVPKTLIAIEKTIKYQGLVKRFDILIYNSNFEPLALVECKAPGVKITNEVFHQISIYNHKLNAPYSFVSNGINHYCFKVDFTTNKVDMLNEFPKFEEMTTKD